MSLSHRYFFLSFCFRLTCLIAASNLLTLPSSAIAAEFNPDVTIKPFPIKELQLDLGNSARIVDFAVSTHEPRVAFIQTNGSAQQVNVWDLNTNSVSTIITSDQIKLTWLVWHPVEETLFLLGEKSKSSFVILRADKNHGWKLQELLVSDKPLRRLFVGPRPYQVGTIDGEPTPSRTDQYRLFFAIKKGKYYHIDTITEFGGQQYQVIGNNKQNIKNTWLANLPAGPSYLPSVKGDILPAGFHPAGHVLAVENSAGCFYSVSYDREWWGDKFTPLYKPQLCHGSISLLPNGLGVVFWQAKQPGAQLIIDQGKTKLPVLTDLKLATPPLVTPDGKALLAHVRQTDHDSLRFIPTAIPLGDIANAWMFVEKPRDRELLARHGGLFRELKYDQLYQLYETELYHCGAYDQSTPTRPYLITTDIFWENFAAAYEGLFILFEREIAIPAFWDFVRNAQTTATPGTKNWNKVFATMLALRASSTEPDINKEVNFILAGTGNHRSVILDQDFDFANVKPRGHYTASAELQAYFRAFRYFTQAAAVAEKSGQLSVAQLTALSPKAKNAATAWVRSYLPFIAGPRAELIWNNQLVTPVAYARDPHAAPTVFPLAWGFDNEILHGTVMHTDWPAAEQIHQRLLPSSLDIAAVLGSDFALQTLANSGEFSRYPNLQPALQKLRDKYRQTKVGNTLYDQWLAALSQQWANNVRLPDAEIGRELFMAKRLQTGLASWATLRHATVLVNERSVAQCGEAGFESILLEFPHGHVESDPATLLAIAKLFDNLGKLITQTNLSVLQTKPNDSQVDYQQRGLDNSLQNGILRRLKESADKTRYFARIAQKEINNEALTRQEYEDIFYAARVAEHHFLVFKSLSKPDMALSNPDPMAKIADVAGGSGTGVLHAAVGKPLEWNFSFPSLGRRRLAKGAVYSFYEFANPVPLDDNQWRNVLTTTQRPTWIQPFMSESTLSCPAQQPF